MSETVTTTPEVKKPELKLTSSPHLHSTWSTQKAMWIVVISILPALVSGVLFFGLYQLIVVFVAIAGAVLTEYAIKYFRKQRITITDGSAVITGLLLGLIVPPNFSLVLVFLGSVVSIAIGKEVFGGLGYNIFNPALVGRAFLQAAFPVAMTTWTKPEFAPDAITSATPLSAWKFVDGGKPFFTATENLFYGNIGGSIGETSALAILLGGALLFVLKIANWRVPAAMVVGMLVFGGIFHLLNPANYPAPVDQIFMGGFLFGAIFMATDWVSSPVTNKGMYIYGLGIALIIVMIRLFGGLPEGVMYAILLMNGFVPLINRYTRPVIFGEEK